VSQELSNYKNDNNNIFIEPNNDFVNSSSSRSYENVDLNTQLWKIIIIQFMQQTLFFQTYKIVYIL